MINTVKGLLSYCLSTLSRDGKEEEKQNKTKNIMYTAKYIKNTIYIGMPPIQERLVKEVEWVSRWVSECVCEWVCVWVSECVCVCVKRKAHDFGVEMVGIWAPHLSFISKTDEGAQLKVEVWGNDEGNNAPVRAYLLAYYYFP